MMKLKSVRKIAKHLNAYFGLGVHWTLYKESVRLSEVAYESRNYEDVARELWLLWDDEIERHNRIEYNHITLEDFIESAKGWNE